MITWQGILGDLLQEKDKGAHFGCYLWHYYLGNTLKPRRIGEIGVRFGYSLKAFIKGALDAGVTPEAYGWDNEQYEPGCMDIVESHISKIVPYKGYKVDTQKLESLRIELDFIHVDGDHTEAGAMHDMNLAWNAVSTHGHILVDDICEPPIAKACFRFMQERTLQGTMIPMHSMAMLIAKDQKHPSYIRKAWEV